MVPIVFDVISYSAKVSDVPGAHNEDAIGENVDIDVMKSIRSHF